MEIRELLIRVVYIVAACLFIFGVKSLGSVRTARRGNILAGVGMLLGILASMAERDVVNYAWIVAAMLVGSAIGLLMARLVQMTQMPQMVAALNGFGGLASVLVASSEVVRGNFNLGAFTMGSSVLGIVIGAVTFSGSMAAFAKLQGLIGQQAMGFPGLRVLSGAILAGSAVLGAAMILPGTPHWVYWTLLSLALVWGILFVMPIGGADMPVVISFLNSLSGIAGAMAGFVLMNRLLIVAGALVGASGLILTGIMCRAMNRSLLNVFVGGFGAKPDAAAGGSAKKDAGYANVKSCSAEDAGMILANAQSVIIVPGYGLAVSRAQHAAADLAELLESRGTSVRYAIHPVAGRMPGHMNILLAEADVAYEKMVEMDDINPQFETTDVALVVGANDVTNPSARTEPGSPIYGMPILDVDKARTVLVIKRSLSPGYAGIKNPLFENERTLIFYEDAKKALEEIIKEIKNQ